MLEQMHTRVVVKQPVAGICGHFPEKRNLRKGKDKK